MAKNKIKADPNNFRIHNNHNRQLINKSLVECGAGRSILIDKENCVIAGNGVLEQSEKLGIPVRIIETDGTELIAIKRTDLKTKDEKRKLLALVDNHTSDTSAFDYDLISGAFGADIIKDWGIDIDFHDVEQEKDIYTQKIQSPIYEPKGEQPTIDLLTDTIKTNELAKRIQESEIPSEVKEFLMMAAQRHTKFNYSAIADYYAHSSDEIKSLMEDSALVIIDINKAIECGFVVLTERIASLYTEDHGE